MISLEYDPEADAVFAAFRAIDPGGDAGIREVDERRFVHYDHAGEVIGVEFLYVSDGIKLNDVPYAEEIAAAIKALGSVKLLVA